LAILAIKACLFIEISSPDRKRVTCSRARASWLAVIRDGHGRVNDESFGSFVRSDRS